MLNDDEYDDRKCAANACNDEYDDSVVVVVERDSAEGPLTEVKGKKRTKHGPKFSNECQYSFSSKYGSKCRETHTIEEQEFFKSNQGMGCTCLQE